MALEIERRFVVTEDSWQSHVIWTAVLQQGYLLCRDDGLTTRVRLQQPADGDDRAWLTIKARAADTAPSHACLEFEYPIPVEDAVALLRLAPWQVSKTRHGLELPGGHWVLDVFSGANAPLVIAEVEINHPDDTPPIPSWCGKEVTGLHRLSNAALARSPWQAWSRDDQNLLNPERLA
ncbi:MAG: CYTH domain-containing protein [Cyanobacteriota bacterium]|nr:CYTH domain-containing protein [Cyanobacteriota bacterium]